MNLFLNCLLLLITNSVIVIKANEPIVKIRNGQLLGSYMYTKNGRKFSAFQGIPYAKPPLGELRFQAPVPADSWQNIRNATEIHAICPQRDIYRRSEIIEGEEDCLYLNVYSPQLSEKLEKPLPVMVFFHGGGWLCGGGNSLWYGPQILLDRDVVLVVPNYRLGALGFLTTGDDIVPGNGGMKDQVLVLKWIQDNIGVFGGDAEQVTVFGESAGGASAQFHTVSPLSKGLFKRAIAQSGTAMCIWALAPGNEGVENGRKLAKALNCPTEDSKKMVDCLRKIDAYKIIEQDKIFMNWDFDPMIPFKPMIEKNAEGAFLIEHPAQTIQAGKVDIPLLLGLTTEDGALRAAGLFGNPHLIDEINNEFERVIPISLMYDKTAKNVDEITEKIKQFYFKNKKLTKNSVKDVVNMYTDGWFLNGIDESVRLQKANSNQDVFLYLFGHRGLSSFTEIFGDPHNNYGVCHADDLQYLFPVGDGLFPDKKPTKDDKKVAEIVTTLWVNFATYGNPTPNTNNLIKEKWLPVESENLEYYFINANETGMRDGLYIERAKFWRNLKSYPKPLLRVKDEF